MVAGIIGLLCLAAMVVLAVAPLVIAFFVLRKSDPEHALRRTAGLGLLGLGSIGLALALVAFMAVLFQGDRVIQTAEFTPNSSCTTHYGVVQLSPASLSVWLLIAGATIALGLLLFLKRFSLRSLLIVLGLVALLASTPHLLVEPHDLLTTISVITDRTFSEEEWRQTTQKLTREALCRNVPGDLSSTLPIALDQAITKVEVQRELGGEAEASGTVGVRLAVRFSNKLGTDECALLFDQLCRQVRNAVPEENGP